MAIGQIELNTAMTRIQDYATQKHNEDQKSTVQQSQVQNQLHKELASDMKQVVKTDQTEYQNRTMYHNKKFDAKEKGSNSYSGDGGKHRKKDEKSDGKVIVKKQGGFDIKI